MIVSIRCERLIKAGDPERAALLNRTVGIASAVGNALLVLFFGWRALTAVPT
jgi:hypothetical protein